MAKKLHSSTKQNNLPKNPRDWKEYLEMIANQSEPSRDAFYKRIAIQLVTWAMEEPKAYSIEQFCCLIGVKFSTFYDWKDKSVEIQDAHEFAMTQFGVTRENICIENSPAYVVSSLPSFLERVAKRENDIVTMKAKAMDANDRPTLIKILENNVCGEDK